MMTMRMLCSDCGGITEFAPLPAEGGFDPAERICLTCGEARWLPPDLVDPLPRRSSSSAA
jgi:hypothetical protein